MPKKCIGKTKKGFNCKKFASKGKKYCHLHVSQENSKIPKKTIKISTVKNDDGTIFYLGQKTKKIYKNQVDCAKKIVEHLSTLNAVCVIGKTQSGKSGVIQCTIMEMHKKNYNANMVVIPFIIIPINDNDIRKQAWNEFCDSNLLGSDGLGLSHENILGLQDLKKNNFVLKNLIDKYKTTNDTKYHFLIFVDESHCNNKLKDYKCSLYDNLLEIGVKINGLIIPNNIKLVTISATPHAEIASLLDKNIKRNKKTVILEPGNGYYGILKMFDNNKVFQSLQVTQPNLKKISNLLLSKYGSLKKYAIVRCRETENIQLQRKIYKDAHKIGLEIRNKIYNSKFKKTKKIDEILSEEPEYFTVIFVCNRMRASLQLNTQHICMVYENPNADVDITVQGLVGRCTGYFKEKHNVDIYCNLEALKLQKKWIESKFSKLEIPKTKLITGGITYQTETKDFFTINKPILMKIDSETLKTILELSEFYDNNSQLYKDQFIKDTVYNIINSEHCYLKDEYKQPFKGSGLMILTNKNASTTIKLWWDKKNIKKRQHGFAVSNKDKCLGTIGYFIYINAIKNHSDFGKVRIYFTKKTDTRYAISEPIKECIYHHEN